MGAFDESAGGASSYLTDLNIHQDEGREGDDDMDMMSERLGCTDA